MAYDDWFDSEENKALTAICTRKLISNIGIGGIIWGSINLIIGIVAIQTTLLNLGILVLALMMLGAGVQALKKPSLGILLTETFIAVLLLIWNVGIAVLNFRAVGTFELRGLIFPAIIAVVLAKYYHKLGHLREQIESIEPEMIKSTKKMCKSLVKTKLKDEPFIVQTTNRKCRAQLMDDKALFIQRDMMRAFIAAKENVQNAIVKPDAKSLKMIFNHPVGKLIYQFDKKNSLKIKDWLVVETELETEQDSNIEQSTETSPESILFNHDVQKYEAE